MVSTAVMEILTLTLILITARIAAVGGSSIDHVVMLGDSYSDNGHGFAEYARFVLQTNAVRPKGLSSLPNCHLHSVRGVQ